LELAIANATRAAGLKSGQTPPDDLKVSYLKVETFEKAMKAVETADPCDCPLGKLAADFKSKADAFAALVAPKESAAAPTEVKTQKPSDAAPETTSGKLTSWWNDIKAVMPFTDDHKALTEEQTPSEVPDAAELKKRPGYADKEKALKKATEAFDEAVTEARGLPEEEKCKECKGTGRKVVTPGKTQDDGKIKPDGTTEGKGNRRRLAPPTESILCLSRIGDSADTILSRRRRLVGDSLDPPVLRALMMKIVEANAIHC